MSTAITNAAILSLILSVVNPFFFQVFKLYLEKLPFINPNVSDQTIHDVSLEVSNILFQAVTVIGAHLLAHDVTTASLPIIVGQILSQSGLARLVYTINTKVLSKKASNDLQNLINQANKIAPELGAALAGVYGRVPVPVPSSAPVAAPTPTVSGTGAAQATIPNLAGLSEFSLSDAGSAGES